REVCDHVDSQLAELVRGSDPRPQEDRGASVRPAREDDLPGLDLLAGGEDDGRRATIADDHAVDERAPSHFEVRPPSRRTDVGRQRAELDLVPAILRPGADHAVPGIRRVEVIGDAVSELGESVLERPRERLPLLSRIRPDGYLSLDPLVE